MAEEVEPPCREVHNFRRTLGLFICLFPLSGNRLVVCAQHSGMDKMFDPYLPDAGQFAQIFYGGGQWLREMLKPCAHRRVCRSEAVWQCCGVQQLRDFHQRRGRVFQKPMLHRRSYATGTRFGRAPWKNC